MRIRHEERTRKSIYGRNQYPLDLLHNEYLVQTQTAFDGFDKHNKFGSHPKQGSPDQEGWAIQEPSPKPATPAESDSPAVPRSRRLLREGYMHAGSRVMPRPLPDQYEQVGGVTVIWRGKYPTPQAAAAAEAARRYHESLVTRYGTDNVEICADEPRAERDGAMLGQQIAYFVRLDTRIPESPPAEHSTTDQ